MLVNSSSTVAVEVSLPFDLVVVDPPTFSRSTRQQQDWDVQRDYADLLQAVADNLSARWVLSIFQPITGVSNLKKSSLLSIYDIYEITRKTVPEDFRNARIHRSWKFCEERSEKFLVTTRRRLNHETRRLVLSTESTVIFVGMEPS